MKPARMLKLAICWPAARCHCSSRCSFLRMFLGPAEPLACDVGKGPALL